MKKTIRFISLFVSIIICLSLCGCVSLDEIRATSGIITDDGVIKLYDGTEYKRLPECEELVQGFQGYTYVDLVKEEMPVLLVSVNARKLVTKSYDGKLLRESTENSEVIYCRSDIYDSLLERIEKGFVADKFVYSYYDYDKGESFFYTLTQAEANAVMEALKAHQTETRNDLEYIEFDSYVDLYLSTEDMLFMKDAVDICILDNKYYLIDYSDNNNQTAELYLVSDEFKDEFASIMKKQIETDEYWEKYE